MTFGTTLREHTMAASANMFYIVIGYKSKANMKVAARKTNFLQNYISKIKFWKIGKN